ncbi:hypothetical protein PHYC_00224 [Phycisphaerales bacterium]|nr:hypothetical protein PHYC_00224 [Phycisphaerales bacterium]
MPRIIRIDATGPFKIEPEKFPRDEQGNLKAIWICACGLTRTFPYCDKSHKVCAAGEKPGVLYTYDPATGQVVDQRSI